METALDKIIAYKREEVAQLKRQRSASDLLLASKAAEPPRGFRRALTATADIGHNALICELKRKSPSAGLIAEGADPVSVAREYEQGGATCLSVLTDNPSFGGSPEDFERIRAAISLPMLRKDFMIDPLQVIESRAMGADAILVIMAAVDDILAAELVQTANQLGMDCLIETHNADEIQRATELGEPLIGVNNRNLKTMTTDLSVTERLVERLPEASEFVSESGISEVADICRLRMTGARRFLIGESLMKRADRQEYVNKLRHAGTN